MLFSLIIIVLKVLFVTFSEYESLPNGIAVVFGMSGCSHGPPSEVTKQRQLNGSSVNTTAFENVLFDPL